MTVPNLICMAGLSGVLISQTRYFLWLNRLDEVNEVPVSSIGNDDEPSEKY